MGLKIRCYRKKINKLEDITIDTIQNDTRRNENLKYKTAHH